MKYRVKDAAKILARQKADREKKICSTLIWASTPQKIADPPDWIVCNCRICGPEPEEE